MRVSVVIRTFNSERTIEQVLTGLRSQSFRDYELVVVDSGSTDSTLELVGEHPHTLIDFSGERFTYSGSLNAGCEAARGEYIVCLSSHCIPLHSEWLGSLVATMDGDAGLAGAWGTLIFDLENYPVGVGGVEVMDLDEFYRRPNQGLQNPNAIIRRSLWQEKHFSEEVERCEDQEWAYHFLRQGYRTALVRDALALYKIPHTPYGYGKKIMRDLLALHEMFGYRPEISVSQLRRRTVHLLGGAALGRKPFRTTELAIASMVGRWLAYRRVLHVEHNAGIKGRAEGDTALIGKAEIARVGGKLRERTTEAGRALAGKQRFSSAELENKTRFFLVGEMRSGTSWLSRTLNSHPEVFCQGEGSFFGQDQAVEEIPVYTGPTPSLHNAISGCQALRDWQALGWNAWGRTDTEQDMLNLTRLAIDYYLAKDSAASGKRIVGDKSPLHTDYVNEIHGIYPEAKTIHIFRDGRDVAVSLMHHFWRLAKDRGGIFELEPEELEKRDAYYADPEGFLKAGNSIFAEERLRQMAVRWSRRVSRASHQGTSLFGSGFTELRYEDMLTRPEDNLMALLEFLGARADDATVRQCVDKNNFKTLAKRSEGQEDASSFFRKGVAGDWRNVFTARDREIYEEIAGDTLHKMGYSLDG